MRTNQAVPRAFRTPGRVVNQPNRNTNGERCLHLSPFHLSWRTASVSWLVRGRHKSIGQDNKMNTMDLNPDHPVILSKLLLRFAPTSQLTLAVRRNSVQSNLALSLAEECRLWLFRVERLPRGFRLIDRIDPAEWFGTHADLPQRTSGRRNQ
jgi:hypothetical protein